MIPITTLSQLGSRASIAFWHLTKLIKSHRDEVKHFVLLPYKHKVKITEMAHKFIDKITIFTEDDFPGGLRRKFTDGNYDLLINKVTTPHFITFHDDTLIYDTAIWDTIDTALLTFNFGGAIDDVTANIKTNNPYDAIIIDNIPMSKLRIGTWLLFGKTERFIQSDYSLGHGGHLYKYWVNLMYRTTRIKLSKVRIWLDGGFNFNILSRINNEKITLIESSKLYATHWARVTNFFHSRGLLEYTDTNEEIKMWAGRFNKLSEEGNQKQFDHDIKYLLSLAKDLESDDIFDELLNTKQIEKFKEIKNT